MTSSTFVDPMVGSYQSATTIREAIVSCEYPSGSAIFHPLTGHQWAARSFRQIISPGCPPLQPRVPAMTMRRLPTPSKMILKTCSLRAAHGSSMMKLSTRSPGMRTLLLSFRSPIRDTTLGLYRRNRIQANGRLSCITSLVVLRWQDARRLRPWAALQIQEAARSHRRCIRLL